ncbi:Na+/H+ antiporter subunit A [Dermabacter vaginalis]|uniref:Na+/H+ antiporter subunit A n=1 Tax=Dermabacter vaginalis TaxID=1630135 RepID=A0ABX6A376_9MICO|nr:Na+/H+ antiporter subunit A [Dermabacter vaginalis]QEU11273.1 Na+/H+ antiporter subunit A [Dermabacter vaginalis]
MIIAIAAHFAMAFIAPLLVKWWRQKAFLPIALIPAATAAYLLPHSPAALAETPAVETYPWIPQFGITLSFALDPLAWLFVLIVSGIGTVIMLYCSRYFKETEPSLARFAGVFTAFSGAMLGLVLADDAMMLFVFWELTTVFSYLLIGHYVTKQASRRAAINALISTTAGGLALMVGLIMLGVEAGSMRISEILTSPAFAAVSPYLVVALVLVLIGAATKSALAPGHFWLPGAMAAPTPVSAYLHAAAMVKGGIYVLLRFAPLLATVGPLTIAVSALGAVTMLLGGWRALRQTDIKLLLAYGTVSQLGFMAAIAGIATPEAVFAGAMLTLAHALFKAPLFMSVGIIDKCYGTRDLRELHGVFKDLPIVGIVAFVSAASMAAFPPLFGFVAKEAVFYTFAEGEPWGLAILAATVAGSVLTVAYSYRFFFHVFPGARGVKHKQPTLRFQLIPAIVAAVSLAAIVLAPQLEVLATLIAGGPSATVGELGHLAVIPDHVSLPLLCSLAALTLGAVLAIAHAPFERVQKAVSPQNTALGRWCDAERLFRASMREVDSLAVRTTAFFQRGSLPVHLGTIFLVFVVMLAGAIAFTGKAPDNLVLFAHPAEIAVVGFAGLAALGAARARRRLRAALLISGTGFGVALLFMMYGAPDVAATQLFVESMMTVVLILVLRRLPAHFSIRPRRFDQFTRWSIAILTAAVIVTVFAYAAGARIAAPIGPELIEAGYEIGKGHNAVNVALVDARVWDTMGEIAVVLVVASGIASLIFVRKREQQIVRVGDLEEDLSIWRRTSDPSIPENTLRFHDESDDLEGNRGATWLLASRTLAPERRMVVLEVITRLAFPMLMVLSIYLLFAGHNFPGGGFAGGLVAGLAITLRYLAGGRYELNEAAPVQAGALLGVGMVLALFTGITPLLLGGTVFQSYVWIGHLPVLGEIELASALVFDIGVYLIVVGLALDILRTLGEQIDRHQEAELDAR